MANHARNAVSCLVFFGFINPAFAHVALPKPLVKLVDRVRSCSVFLSKPSPKPFDLRMYLWERLNENEFMPLYPAMFKLPDDPSIAAERVQEIVRATMELLPSKGDGALEQVGQSQGTGLSGREFHDLMNTSPTPHRRQLEGPRLAAERVQKFLKSKDVGAGDLFVPPYKAGGVKVVFVRTQARQHLVEVQSGVKSLLNPTFESQLQERIALIPVAAHSTLSLIAKSFIDPKSSLDPLMENFRKLFATISKRQPQNVSITQMENSILDHLRRRMWSVLLQDYAQNIRPTNDSEMDLKMQQIDFDVRAVNAFEYLGPQAPDSFPQLEPFLNQYINKKVPGIQRRIKFTPEQIRRGLSESKIFESTGVARRMNLVHEFEVERGVSVYLAINFGSYFFIDRKTKQIRVELRPKADDDQVHITILPNLDSKRLLSQFELDGYINELRNDVQL